VHPPPAPGGPQGYSTAYTTKSHIQVVCKGSNPAHSEIARRWLALQDFSYGATASPLRCQAEAYSYPTTARGKSRRILARILT
jgi:hypothetical protein